MLGTGISLVVTPLQVGELQATHSKQTQISHCSLIKGQKILYLCVHSN